MYFVSTLNYNHYFNWLQEQNSKNAYLTFVYIEIILKSFLSKSLHRGTIVYIYFSYSYNYSL